MAFQKLDEFLDDTLLLPGVNGKDYVVESPDGKTGIWCQKLLERGADAKRREKLGLEPDEDAKLDDIAEHELYERVLGPVLQEMLDDGVKWKKIQHCGVTALFWCAGNTETAEKYWNAGGDPEELARLAPNRATRRASGSKTKAGGGAGSRTRKAASTSGTKKRG